LRETERKELNMSDHALFVSVPRFAEIVGLSERMCWMLIRRKVLPVYRIRRRTLIKTKEGVAALEQAADRDPSRDTQSPGSGR
jgi:hypothetical protein